MMASTATAIDYFSYWPDILISQNRNDHNEAGCFFININNILNCVYSNKIPIEFFFYFVFPCEAKYLNLYSRFTNL